VPDPKRAEGNDAEIALAFANTYKMLARRIGIFLALPHESLDKMALESEIDAIGKSPDEPAHRQPARRIWRCRRASCSTRGLEPCNATRPVDIALAHAFCQHLAPAEVA